MGTCGRFGGTFWRHLGTTCLHLGPTWPPWVCRSKAQEFIFASLGGHLGPKQAPLNPILTLMPSNRPLDGGRHSTSPWQSHSPLTPRGLSLGAFLHAGSIDQGEPRSRLTASDLSNSKWRKFNLGGQRCLQLPHLFDQLTRDPETEVEKKQSARVARSVFLVSLHINPI